MRLLDNLSKEPAFYKRVLELVDPVAWLRANTAFNPWSYETELLRDNQLRVRVVRKSRQIGITTTIAHEAVWKAFTSKRVILIVSPSQRQSWIVMSKIQAIVNSNPRLAALVSVKNRNQMQLNRRQYPSKSSRAVAPRSPSSVTHAFNSTALSASLTTRASLSSRGSSIAAPVWSAAKRVDASFAVAARVVGDDRRGVVLAARDTTADSRRLAGLDRRDRLHLGRGSARIWRMGWHCDDTVMTRRKPIS